MIDRYSVPELTKIWSDENKFQTWLRVEIAVVQAWGKAGVIPQNDVELISKNAKIHVPDIMQYIEETHHDVTAFLRSISDSLGSESRWVHYGLTSNDVWDTATCLQWIETIDFLTSQSVDLRNVIMARAKEHKNTVCIGRTHGIHAEPTTFGLKLLVWVEELQRHIERLTLARTQIAVGQMSGPVGTHASVPPSVESEACNILGLNVDPVTTQIIQRDRHAFVLSVLAGVGASLEKFATEIRGLQRTEVREAEEPFSEGSQTGSSSMPHKRNPELCERVCGLARTLRGYANVGLENINLWHERDISHSSAERIIFPDSSGLLAYMLKIFTEIMTGLVVYPEQMKNNIEQTKGLIFSAKILNALLLSGLDRESAYKIVQNHAMNAWHNDLDFRDLIKNDSVITTNLPPGELDSLFSIEEYLTHIEDSFLRVKNLGYL
ncbi:MAG: adenylosuccinate lyase [Chloroflexi bacterium]|nr:adenylosuccinate lyase [Chloroflexota bacterium]|tara:strand:+ start:2886 stop:4193 length:1308 start_codon:yes stop_codon:yes gene_type:complete